MKEENALIVLKKRELTAPLKALEEYEGIYQVLYSKVAERLEACKTEEDDDGNKVFLEPPDLKWYLTELRKCLQPIVKLEGDRDNKVVEGKMDILKIMASQSKLTLDEKIKIRKMEIESK